MIDDMSMEGMAEVLKLILDKEIQGASKQVDLIGHSMGGYVVLAMVEKYSNLFNSLGLFHSTSYPDTEEKKATRRKGIEFIKEHGAFEFLKTTSPNLFSPETKAYSPQMVDDFIFNLKNFSPAALTAYYESMIRRPDRTAVLKNARVPVLFMMGKFDNAAPLADVLKQCHLPEQSHIHVFQKSGHMGMLEEPEKSNIALEHFLA